MSQATEKRQIQARLIEQGSNFRQFALSHGYEVRTVTQVVQRWAGQKTLPRGRLTFQILQDLSRLIGKEVLPGILPENTEQTTAQAV
jgi:hypothetical protein